MSKIIVKKTPSEALLAEAQQEATITAQNGKVISLRKPGITAQFDLVHDLGDSAANTTYMNMVIPLTWAVSIDGQAVMPLKSRLQINALIQRLGDDGVAAVMQHVRNYYEQKNASDEAAALKNLSGPDQ